jgi:glyoxylase-like metal-dependent hydrolase (beta-lactamase superfamily II)
MIGHPQNAWPPDYEAVKKPATLVADLVDGTTLAAGGLSAQVVATPGHTPGGVTLRCGGALFTGDTLFKGSCGRTDLPGGDMEQELQSLRRICSLPGDYEVYPGHMDSSTLSRERLFNSYCRLAANR